MPTPENQSTDFRAGRSPLAGPCKHGEDPFTPSPVLDETERDERSQGADQLAGVERMRPVGRSRPRSDAEIGTAVGAQALPDELRRDSGVGAVAVGKLSRLLRERSSGRECGASRQVRGSCDLRRFEVHVFCEPAAGAPEPMPLSWSAGATACPMPERESWAAVPLSATGRFCWGLVRPCALFPGESGKRAHGARFSDSRLLAGCALALGGGFFGSRFGGGRAGVVECLVNLVGNAAALGDRVAVG